MPSGYSEQTRSRLKVAIVGGLSPIKGVDAVEAVIRQAELHELPVDFVVIGFTTRPLYAGCGPLLPGHIPAGRCPIFSSESGRTAFVPASNSRDF